jgi:flagellar biosynthesis protein FlhF
VFADMIESEVHEELARTLIERLRRAATDAEMADADLLKARLVRIVQNDICVSGPIQTAAGRRKLVALVGPTGVGKTTTIAKLAAQYRLKERLRVGLITVDTFRIAAVEQLRAYADIIDLPMEVVSSSEEMRPAISRLADLDLILMDTAGRSPRDEPKLQELKAIFAESAPDEVHLVLSATCGTSNLVRMADRFSEVGVTSLLLTKLDESHGLGNLLSLVQRCQIPLSYLTNGQNVPDDIEVADAERLARTMVGI